MKPLLSIVAITCFTMSTASFAGGGNGKRAYLVKEYDLHGMDGNHYEETCRIYNTKVVITSRINSGPVATHERHISPIGPTLEPLIAQSAMEPLVSAPTQCDGGNTLLWASRPSGTSFTILDARDCAPGSMERTGAASDSLRAIADETCVDAL